MEVTNFPRGLKWPDSGHLAIVSTESNRIEGESYDNTKD
jgi:hypothetical protein